MNFYNIVLNKSMLVFNDLINLINDKPYFSIIFLIIFSLGWFTLIDDSIDFIVKIFKKNLKYKLIMMLFKLEIIKDCSECILSWDNNEGDCGCCIKNNSMNISKWCILPNFICKFKLNKIMRCKNEK